ncbi:MAG: tRNA preQ1(34) S-adenosylmethionine ribosyltransferase-isomerase QueA [candidate division Zixibacteria bacterium]
MKLSDFDYQLPPGLIAQYPAEKRSESRMLVLDRSNHSISDRYFHELPEIIDDSFFLVVNDSRVFKARMFGNRATGGKVEIFLVRCDNNNRWIALLRPSGRIKKNEKIYFSEKLYITVVDDPGPVERMIEFVSGEIENEIIEKFGLVPLPPYIKREATEEDISRYQTVYAESSGSVAAPTAGLHFDEPIIDKLNSRGISIEKLTLHVGPGTFKPVTSENIEDHIIDAEMAHISDETADAINEKKARGKKLLAVGTTSIRTLEYAVDDNGLLKPIVQFVDLFIYPPYDYKIVNCMITNFHLPKTSLLMLVSAFCGRGFLLEAYQHAVEEKYRFYSYGDCMLIL